MSVLTKNTSAPWQGLSSLTGKRVGWLKDYDVIIEEQRGFTLREYRTTEQGLEMLNAGEMIATGSMQAIYSKWDLGEMPSVLQDAGSN